MILQICALLKPKSSFTIFIKGAMPNQPKKQKKKVIQVIWNVCIWIPLKENTFNTSSGLLVLMFFITFLKKEKPQKFISPIIKSVAPTIDFFQRR